MTILHRIPFSLYITVILPLHLAGTYKESAFRGYNILRRNVWGGAYVFSVDPDRGFSLKGRVRHYDE